MNTDETCLFRVRFESRVTPRVVMYSEMGTDELSTIPYDTIVCI